MTAIAATKTPPLLNIADKAESIAQSIIASIVNSTHAASGSDRIPDQVAATMLEQDVYRILLPEDMGGAGFDPWQQFEMVERISACDASVGWNFAVGSGIGLFAGYLPPEQVREMFATPDVCIAGSGAPQGTAARVGGGYLVRGRFRWASGIDQARWVYGGCFVTRDGERQLNPNGTPAIVQVFAPKEDAIIHENWQVGGLQATGSKDFTLDDVFIPDRRSFAAPVEIIYHPAPIFRVPPTFFGFALSGVPIGVAQKVIAALKELATCKLAAGGDNLREQTSAQYAVARAEALVDASRANLQLALSGLWAPLLGGRTPTIEARARVRRAIVLTAESCTEAVTLCYRAAGGSALFRSAPFEAALRDIHAIGGHLVFQRGMMENAGRTSFGLPPLLPIF